MKFLALTMIVSAAMLAIASPTAHASSTSEDLGKDHINIQSVLNPYMVIKKTQPVTVVVTPDGTIEDKQLGLFLKADLVADGFTVTAAGGQTLNIVAAIHTNSTMLTYYTRGFFSPNTNVATQDYTTVTIAVFYPNDAKNAGWVSSVYMLHDFWMYHEEAILQAIIATYGINFYYQDESPREIPSDVVQWNNQPFTREQAVACLANPKVKFAVSNPTSAVPVGATYKLPTFDC